MFDDYLSFLFTPTHEIRKLNCAQTFLVLQYLL